LILGPGRARQPDGSASHHTSIIDLDAVGDAEYGLYQLPLEFYDHRIVPDPVNPERAAVFQKKGPGACEADTKSLEGLRPIQTASRCLLTRRGALYATETILDGQSTGLIAVCDARTHTNLGQFPTYGASPHDCRLIDGGKTRCITNGGGPLEGARPCVTYVDVESEELIKKLEFASPRIDAGHLAVSVRGDLTVVSAQRDGLDPYTAAGGVSLRSPANGCFLILQQPQAVVSSLLGDTLSVGIDEKNGVVAATTPMANARTFWDMASTELLGYYRANNPRGVTLTADGRFFVFSYESPPHISLISTNKLEKVAVLDVQRAGMMNGSHIINYGLPSSLRG